MDPDIREVHHAEQPDVMCQVKEEEDDYAGLPLAPHDRRPTSLMPITHPAHGPTPGIASPAHVTPKPKITRSKPQRVVQEAPVTDADSEPLTPDVDLLQDGQIPTAPEQPATNGRRPDGHLHGLGQTHAGQGASEKAAAPCEGASGHAPVPLPQPQHPHNMPHSGAGSANQLELQADGRLIGTPPCLGHPGCITSGGLPEQVNE